MNAQDYEEVASTEIPFRRLIIRIRDQDSFFLAGIKAGLVEISSFFDVKKYFILTKFCCFSGNCCVLVSQYLLIRDVTSAILYLFFCSVHGLQAASCLCFFV